MSGSGYNRNSEWGTQYPGQDTIWISEWGTQYLGQGTIRNSERGTKNLGQGAQYPG